MAVTTEGVARVLHARKDDVLLAPMKVEQVQVLIALTEQKNWMTATPPVRRSMGELNTGLTALLKEYLRDHVAADAVIDGRG